MLKQPNLNRLGDASRFKIQDAGAAKNQFLNAFVYNTTIIFNVKNGLIMINTSFREKYCQNYYYDSDYAVKSKSNQTKELIKKMQFNEAKQVLSQLTIYILADDRSSPTKEARRRLMLEVLLPKPHESYYEQCFLKFCCSDQIYNQLRSPFEEHLKFVISLFSNPDVSPPDASLQEEINEHSDLYECYYNEIFSRKIEHLRRDKNNKPCNINTDMPVFTFTEVLPDGLGDFTIALDVLKTYKKRFINPIHLIVLCEPTHLAKIKQVFKQSIEQLQTKDAVAIEWHTDDVSFRDVSRHNANQAVLVAASTGYFHFPEGSQVDCLHEICIPAPVVGSDFHTRNEYSTQRLALKLGFSPSSAGVFMPEKSSLSLQQALIATGCFPSIQQSTGLKDASLEQILQKNDLTIRYMHEPSCMDRYHMFLRYYAEASGKTIHLLIPTDNADKLAISSEVIAPSVIGHYCPFPPSDAFHALVQQATVPPGVTGNNTFLQALTGQTPWFYDAREGGQLPVMSEFVKYTSEIAVHPATRRYLDFMERASAAEHQRPVSEADFNSITSEMIAYRTEIQRDLQNIHQYLIDHRNAGVLMSNRLQELLTKGAAATTA